MVCSLFRPFWSWHGSFPHMRWVVFPPFKQFANKGINWLQDSISNKLHNHSFFNIIFDMVFDSHYAHLKSCVGLRASAWLFAHPIIPSFYLASNVFSFALHTRLGSHPLTMSWLITFVANLQIQQGPTFFVIPMVRHYILHLMMPFKMPSPPLWKMWGFMFQMNKFISFAHPHFNFFTNMLTLSY